MTGRSPRLRGPHRAFSIEEALDRGERLFFEKPYDSIGVSAITKALEIGPPSFYLAFGSKFQFFSRILNRYADCTLRAADILVPGRPVAEALADLLGQALALYCREAPRRGCLVFETARGGCAGETAALAGELLARRLAEIEAFVAPQAPRAAAAVASYVVCTMGGLSMLARQGQSEAELAPVLSASRVAIDALLHPAGPEGR